jgi:hypothetical protein
MYLPPQNPGVLTFRLTESPNACAEVNAGTPGDFLEISIDGAGSQCTTCATASCRAFYQSSQVHVVRAHGTERTELGPSWVDLICDDVNDGGMSRARINLRPPDAGDLHFLIVSPLCRPDNDCSSR